MKTLHWIIAYSIIGAGAAYLCACEKKQSPAPPAPSGGGTGSAGTTADDHGHDHDHDHDNDHDHGHGGAVIDLGATNAGGFDIKATRDEGAIAAGGEAAIDVTVTATPGTTAKVAAVRFWIGTEDAAGSVKSKADIEDPDEPNRWHTHVEIPDPLPAGAKLWVEIETDGGQTHVAGFALSS